MAYLAHFSHSPIYVWILLIAIMIKTIGAGESLSDWMQAQSFKI
jgi:hypothetical protein